MESSKTCKNYFDSVDVQGDSPTSCPPRTVLCSLEGNRTMFRNSDMVNPIILPQRTPRESVDMVAARVIVEPVNWYAPVYTMKIHNLRLGS